MKKNNLKIYDFYYKHYSVSVLYTAFRTIASYVDGLKLSHRKIVYTVDKFNIVNEVKVAQLMSDTSKLTDYLHGEQSLYSGMLSLSQDFVGSNNINLLSPEGSFGSRHTPAAAAPRYIYTKKSKYFDILFNKDE